MQCRRPWSNSWVGKILWKRDRLLTPVFLRFPCDSAGKESTCNAGNLGLIPWLGRYFGEEKGSPLNYSGLENSMDCIIMYLPLIMSILLCNNIVKPLHVKCHGEIGEYSKCEGVGIDYVPGSMMAQMVKNLPAMQKTQV